MIVAFWGALALFFLSFGFGALAFPFRRSDAGFFVLFSVGASLLVAWLVALLAYWLHLPSLVLKIGLLACCFGLVWRTRPIVVENFERLRIIAVVAVFYFGTLFAVFSQAPIGKLFFAHRWTPLFQWSDTISSWNNWAMQLANGEFRPFHNLYPTGWPGLWSFVYRVQDDTYFWFFAKASLFINHLCLAILIALFLRYTPLLISAQYAVFTVSFFVFTHSWASTTGYMDVPVTMLGFVGLSLLFLWLHSTGAEAESPSQNRLINQPLNQSADAGNFVLLAALFIGFAAITKQAGLLIVMLFAASILLFAIHKRVGWLKAAFYLSFAALPFATFAALYFSSQVDPHIIIASDPTAPPSVFGLSARLKEFAIVHGKELGSVWVAFRLAERGFLPGFLYLYVIVSFANFYYWRRLEGQFGLLLLGFSIVGLFAFASCCAYDVRNGLWLYAVFSIASLNPLMIYLKDRRSSNSQTANAGQWTGTALSVSAVPAALVLMTLVGLLATAGRTGVTAWNDAQLARKTSQEFHQLLVDKLPPVENRNPAQNAPLPTWVIASTDRGIANYKPARGHAIACPGNDSACVARITSCFDNTYLASTPTDGYYNFNDVIADLSPDLFIGEGLRRQRTPYAPHKLQLWGPIARTETPVNAPAIDCASILRNKLG